MDPNGFWGTLDMFVGHENKRTGKDVLGDVGNWLNTFPEKGTDANYRLSKVSHDDTTGYGGSETYTSVQRSLSSNRLLDLEDFNNKQQINDKLVEGKNQKKSKQSKNKHRYDKLYNDDDLLLPPIDCSFNITGVTAQLERLMGTNVVRLTDRNYMQELQRRIQDAYVESIKKRIESREHVEDERQKNLILKGRYKIQHCSKQIIEVHSIVLAQDMERENTRLLDEKSEKLQPESIKLNTHTVFVVNQNTNNIISKRRAKLKSIREKHVNRLIDQGIKWEREHLLLEEKNRLKAAEEKKRRDKLLETEQLYKAETDVQGMKLLRIKSKKFTVEEEPLKKFLEEEKNEKTRKKLKKRKPTKRKSKLKTKSLSVLDQREQKGFVQEIFKSDAKPDKEDPRCSKSLVEVFESDISSQASIMAADSYVEDIPDDQHAKMLEEIRREEIKKQHMMDNIIYQRFHYEEPMIAKLRDTNNVKDMYKLADEIVVITKK